MGAGREKLLRAVTPWVGGAPRFTGGGVHLIGPRPGRLTDASPLPCVTPDGYAGVVGPRVLLVEDYVDTRDLYVHYLSTHGYRVAEAATGFEGLRKALDLVPDVILMDLSLPGIDGWTVTRLLKQDARAREIPVIAVTAHGGDRDRQSALDAGCVAVLLKPCAPHALASAIARTLNETPGRG